MTDASRDVIAASISGRIDWGTLEDLYSAVLIADDMPALRQIGGVADQGADGIEEAFYDGARKITTVVQITSDRAQRGKVRGTISKLKKNGIDVRNLIFATRHPVSAEIRRAIIEEAEEDGVTVDIRDDKYLTAQLSLPNSRIFSRFFGSARSQLDELLAKPDPLETTSEPLQHALLASMGAFVLSPHSRIARNTLFDKSVLAALASAATAVNRQELLASLSRIYPGETIDADRLQAALDRLEREGSIERSRDRFSCKPEIIDRFLGAAKKADTGFHELLSHVVKACRKVRQIDDAQRGYIERNIRNATLQMLRVAGPIGIKGQPSATWNEQELAEIFGKNLPSEVSRAAVLAFSDFTADEENAKLLAPLARSYAALAVRNLDPFGRRWQQNVLSRSCLVLDTDALLSLIIEELPEHHAILASLKSLQEEGVEIVVPDHVMDEAVSHIGRAQRTFIRFSESLLRLPSAVVDATVWHTVVRGYYYAARSGSKDSARKYWLKYYDATQPRPYVEHLLSRRVRLTVRRLDEVHKEDEQALSQLEIAALETKERSRMKARFRDSAEMAARVRRDISMALNLARSNSSDMGAAASGYIVTADKAFQMIELDENWKPRASVVLNTTALTSLAAFVCGTRLDDDEIVQLLFHPVTIAAADQISPQIGILAAVGVDLMNTPLDRLDWDLRHKLSGKIEEIGKALAGDATDAQDNAALASLELARMADDIGYSLASPVKVLVGDYQVALETVTEERRSREELEEKIRQLLQAATGGTNKGRRRINRLVRELGLTTLLDEEDETHVTERSDPDSLGS